MELILDKNMTYDVTVKTSYEVERKYGFILFSDEDSDDEEEDEEEGED